nr:hypothetical protein [Tanacetum cinerariifolium]
MCAWWERLYLCFQDLLGLGTEGVVFLISLTVTVPETLLLGESYVSGFVCFMIPKPDDAATNKKIEEASKTLAKISTQTIEILSSAQPIIIIQPKPSVPQREGKCIVTDDQAEFQRKVIKASSIVHLDLDEPVRVEFMINGKIVYLTEQEIQEYSDKEEEIKKAKEEARLNAIRKTEVIKVARKEAKKLGIHKKEAITSKAVYRGTDGRNFDVHKPFLFRAFDISELNELREIIPKKKYAAVKDLMNSLSQRYERLRKITRKLRIQSALPTPEQAPSQTSRRKWKHMELEPETRIPELECNQALLENVPFVNNMVIEEPKYGIFFTNEFGDQAFQRWSDIAKVGMEALVSYLVAASMVKSPENARFSMKLRKLIVEHPNKEKLKSKKVKLEALGYKID